MCTDMYTSRIDPSIYPCTQPSLVSRPCMRVQDHPPTVNNHTARITPYSSFLDFGVPLTASTRRESSQDGDAQPLLAQRKVIRGKCVVTNRKISNCWGDVGRRGERRRESSACTSQMSISIHPEQNKRQGFTRMETLLSSLASWRVRVGAPEHQRSITKTSGRKGGNNGERENGSRRQQLIIVLRCHSQIQYWRGQAFV